MNGWLAGQEAGLDPLREQLAARGVVRPLAPNAPEELARQAEYWRALTDEPKRALRRIERASVSIVGVGGIGSVVLQHLLGAGVSRFTLLDADRVEPSNFNRQFIFSASQIGRRKVDAARDFIADRNPSAHVTVLADRWDAVSDDQHEYLFSGADLVVSAIDHPTIDAAIDVLDVAWANGVASIMATAGLRRSLVTPVFDRGRSPRRPREVLRRSQERSSGRLLASHGPVNSLPGILAADRALHHIAGLHDRVEYAEASIVRWPVSGTLDVSHVAAVRL
jgi:molybdopterin/thiamine biosynthesis adenylyltransferase